MGRPAQGEAATTRLPGHRPLLGGFLALALCLVGAGAATAGPLGPMAAARGPAGLAGPGPAGAGPRAMAPPASGGMRPGPLGSGLAAVGPGAAAPGEGVGYRLVETWQGAPWSLRAGHFGQAADVASAPDGQALYALDSRHGAVHRLARDGRVLGVWRLPDPGPLPAGWTWVTRRLDAGPDGSLYLLRGAARVRQVYRVRVERLSPEGALLAAFERDGDYYDLAVGPDGRVFLARLYAADPDEEGPGGVDVFDLGGRMVAAVGPQVLTMASAVDVDADGTVYVVNRVPSPAGNPPPPGTPLPSGARPLAAAPRQERAPEGVAIFAPDLAYRRTEVFMGPEDVGVGRAGVFVSRTGEIFRLGEAAPLYTAPPGSFTSFWLGGSVFRLNVPASGGLVAAMNHCYHQGLAAFDDLAPRPASPRLFGRLDRPPLEGPVFPLRAAADEGLAVLQGRFTILGERPRVSFHAVPLPIEPQVVQRWSGAGELEGQLGVCASTRPGRDLSDVWWARDVAMDGSGVYVLDPELVHRRPSEGFPAWSYWPGEAAAPGEASELVALDADAGRVAVLDAGARSVTVLDEAGQPRFQWSTADLGALALPADLALSGERLFLADQGAARVAVRALDGAAQAEWPVHDGPAAIAATPEGDLVVLGRGGWLYRYRPDGELVAAWALPAGEWQATDVAVGPDGRVFVPFVERLGSRDSRGFPTAALLSAGVWVFRPGPGGGPPRGEAGSCVAVPDKRAEPAVLPLGETVTVRLDLTGACPGRSLAGQTMIVFDTSRSMNWDEALARAKAGVRAWLDGLDAGSAAVGLATFDAEAALELPLSTDLARVRARVAALDAFGDTRPSHGLELALAELTGPRADPSLTRTILLVTDGNFDFRDRPDIPADRARLAGIGLWVLAFPTPEFNESLAELLAELTGVPQRKRLLVEPGRAQLTALWAETGQYLPTGGLFERLTVTDVLPANMRYLPGSARPPASLVGDTLRWELPPVGAGTALSLTYRLLPQEVGSWPTNVRAEADYRDALGREGRLLFPVPRVRVWDRASLTERAYLPFLGARACFRGAAPLDVALVLDTSVSMSEPSGGGGSKLDAARAAAGRFVGLLRLPADRAAVIGFNDEATLALGLSGDAAAIRAGLGGLATAPGTRIDRGLAAAADSLDRDARPTARRVVVLLTDGLQTGEAQPVRDAADRLHRARTAVYAIGLGAGVDADLLRAVAGEDSRYLASPGPDDLVGIYRDLVERLSCEG